MKLKDLNLQEILKFQPEDGKILLGDHRMLMFRQDAFAKMWLLLREQLGSDLSKAIISQFGYRCGFGDYEALTTLFEWKDEQERLSVGPIMHTWEGIVKAVPTEVAIDIPRKKVPF